MTEKVADCAQITNLKLYFTCLIETIPNSESSFAYTIRNGKYFNKVQIGYYLKKNT